MIGSLVRDLWSRFRVGHESRVKFAVTVVSPAGYIHSAAFHEVAESIHYGLIELGHSSVLTTEGAIPGRRHIVLGSNLLPFQALPLAPDAILYNLEQADSNSPWLGAKVLGIFRQHVVWDYSERNAEGLESMGVMVACVVPIGYAKELTRFSPDPEPDIDVLFFGSMNTRRRHVIDQMLAAGLRVETRDGLYGEARDALIKRAKVVLNIHYYEAKILEVVRLSYLLANHCAVLSERGIDAAEDAAYAEGVAFADYDRLAQRARELVDNPPERQRLMRRGFEIISARPAKNYLSAALAKMP